MIDEGGCGAIGGIKIGRGNRSTRRKPAPAPLCPPQIPHDLHDIIQQRNKIINYIKIAFMNRTVRDFAVSH
jgi:hypothetical protein